MSPWLIVFAALGYLVAPIVELRLWRAGRLSDRAVTVLMLARMPLLLGLLAFANGRFPDPVLILGTALIAALGYRWLLAAVRERGEQLRENRI